MTAGVLLSDGRLLVGQHAVLSSEQKGCSGVDVCSVLTRCMYVVCVVNVCILWCMMTSCVYVVCLWLFQAQACDIHALFVCTYIYTYKYNECVHMSLAYTHTHIHTCMHAYMVHSNRLKLLLLACL
jgi:hypothetical protein